MKGYAYLTNQNQKLIKHTERNLHKEFFISLRECKKHNLSNKKEKIKPFFTVTSTNFTHS